MVMGSFELVLAICFGERCRVSSAFYNSETEGTYVLEGLEKELLTLL